jgi:hypothetical protein
MPAKAGTGNRRRRLFIAAPVFTGSSAFADDDNGERRNGLLDRLATCAWRRRKILLAKSLKS